MSRRLEGRAALITGASRGLGRAIAHGLAREGCSVALLDLRLSWTEAAAEAVEADGGMAMALAADVSDREALQAAMERAANAFGRLDVLVNNAMWNRYQPLGEIDAPTLNRIVAVGFEGVVWGMQAAAPLMRPHGGSIINIASMAALLGVPSGMIYCGVKAGVAGLTRAAAAELGAQGIRVNAIAPSTVDTEGVRMIVSEERLQLRAGQSPLGRLGLPEDIANVACYLASDDSGFMTGQMIPVDGGMGVSIHS